MWLIQNKYKQYHLIELDAVLKIMSNCIEKKCIVIVAINLAELILSIYDLQLIDRNYIDSREVIGV